VVLNHILSSYIANIASGLVKKESQLPHTEALKLVKKGISVLNESNKKLQGEPIEFNIGKTPTVSDAEKVELSAEDTLLKEQLGFINKISYDIAKITDNILQ
jgi:hypothetical protein